MLFFLCFIHLSNYIYVFMYIFIDLYTHGSLWTTWSGYGNKTRVPGTRVLSPLSVKPEHP